jgi:hypothetical protein
MWKEAPVVYYMANPDIQWEGLRKTMKIRRIVRVPAKNRIDHLRNLGPKSKHSPLQPPFYARLFSMDNFQMLGWL